MSVTRASSAEPGKNPARTFGGVGQRVPKGLRGDMANLDHNHLLRKHPQRAPNNKKKVEQAQPNEGKATIRERSPFTHLLRVLLYQK